ncbi:MAG: hypothetical protein ABIP80_00210 [Ferruginibacter sp.]
MEHLITSYLFAYKKCPLPGIGSLQLKQRTASHVIGEKQLLPPVPYIVYTSTDEDSTPFINYISQIGNIPTEAASEKLAAYCTRITQMQRFSEIELPNAGKFYVNTESELSFRQVPFVEELMPTVFAERITHPETPHTLIVGDRESDSVRMAEYLTYDEPVKKDRWWIWALILLVLASLVIFIYLNDYGSSSGFGNSRKLPAKSAPKPYSE